jgi:hypothetical protein
MMESKSQRSESSGHTSNTPPRKRHPHLAMACMPSSPSCFEAAASLGSSCDSSANLFSLQDMDHRYMPVSDERRRAFQHQKEDRPVEGDMGKISRSNGDDVMPLNHARWSMLADKDHNPNSSDSLPPTRSNKSAIQRKFMSHHRWTSEIGEFEQLETTKHWSAAEEYESHTISHRQESVTSQVSGCRDRHITETSGANVVSTMNAKTLSVPSMIAVQTWHPHCDTTSIIKTDPETRIRRRSFDENPTLPQRQQSNKSSLASDDFSSSSHTSFES